MWAKKSADLIAYNLHILALASSLVLAHPIYLFELPKYVSKEESRLVKRVYAKTS